MQNGPKGTALSPTLWICDKTCDSYRPIRHSGVNSSFYGAVSEVHPSMEQLMKLAWCSLDMYWITVTFRVLSMSDLPMARAKSLRLRWSILDLIPSVCYRVERAMPVSPESMNDQTLCIEPSCLHWSSMNPRLLSDCWVQASYKNA